MKNIIFNQDQFYLLEFFKSMKDFFEIKLFHPEDDLKFIYQIIFQKSNYQEFSEHFFLRNRFIEILDFINLKSDSENKNEMNSSEKNKNLNNNASNNNKIFLKSKFQESQSSVETILKDKFFIKEKKLLNFKKFDIDLDIFVKIFYDKPINLLAKEYFTNDIRYFLQSIKFALQVFKEKSIKFQKCTIFDSSENNPTFLVNKLISKKVLMIENHIFNKNFMQYINNQQHIIMDNKIDQLIPFGIVGYHFKENKRNISKRKKKYKKVLFKKELKYKQEKF